MTTRPVQYPPNGRMIISKRPGRAIHTGPKRGTVQDSFLPLALCIRDTNKINDAKLRKYKAVKMYL